MCGCARCPGLAWSAVVRSAFSSATLPCASRSPRAGAGRAASSLGAVQAVIEPAWGSVLLVLLVAGLGAYTLTQLIEAVYRPSHAGNAIGRWRRRAVSSWGCLLYSVFCLSTAWLVVAARPRGTAWSEQRQDTDVTAALLRTGWGRLLLVLVGVVTVAAGVQVGRRPVRLDFRERFTAVHMSRALATITRALGALGCVARSVVFVLVGFLPSQGLSADSRHPLARSWDRLA